MLTSALILARHNAAKQGVVVHLYAPDAIPTVKVNEDGSFEPAVYRTHVHVGTRYMRAAS